MFPVVKSHQQEIKKFEEKHMDFQSLDIENEINEPLAVLNNKH